MDGPAVFIGCLVIVLALAVSGAWFLNSRCPRCSKIMTWTSVGMYRTDEDRWVCFHCDYERECRLGNFCARPTIKWIVWRKGKNYFLRPKSGGNILDPTGWEQVLFDPSEFEEAKKKALGLK